MKKQLRTTTIDDDDNDDESFGSSSDLEFHSRIVCSGRNDDESRSRSHSAQPFQAFEGDCRNARISSSIFGATSRLTNHRSSIGANQQFVLENKPFGRQSFSTHSTVVEATILASIEAIGATFHFVAADHRIASLIAAIAIKIKRQRYTFYEAQQNLLRPIKNKQYSLFQASSLTTASWATSTTSLALPPW